MTHAYPQQQATPQWAIVGTPTPTGRYQVWATQDLLPDALLTYIYDYHRDHRSSLLDSEDRPRTKDSIYILELKMKTFIIAVGDTYADALKHLFDRWTPNDGDASGRPLQLAPDSTATIAIDR